MNIKKNGNTTDGLHLVFTKCLSNTPTSSATFKEFMTEIHLNNGGMSS